MATSTAKHSRRNRMMREWKVPVSAPDLLVSNRGDVILDGEMVHITDNGHGYKQVVVTLYGKRRKYYVHRLVAECFVSNPKRCREVNHKDGDKANNDYTNLEWCTRSENMLHAYRTGLKANTTPRHMAAAMRNLQKAWRRAAA
jgi:hypothetical protein